MNSTIDTAGADTTQADALELEDQAQLDAATLDGVAVEPRVRIAKEQYSVFELLRHIDKGRVVLAPDFQRHDVWNNKQQIEFVESLLMEIPIPLMYLFEDENGIRQVVDGRQRITTLKRFVNDEFRLKRLVVLSQYNDKKFTELSPLLQGKIEDYQLNAYVIQPPTPEAIKFNIFDRVNRAGTQLNKQEIRHALYQGKATELLAQIAGSDIFKQATGNTVKSLRMRDRYLLLRYLAFYLYHHKQLDAGQYKGDIDALLAVVMKAVNQMSTAQVDVLKQMLLRGLTHVYAVLSDNAFRFNRLGKRSPVNVGLFEILLFIFQAPELAKPLAKVDKQWLKSVIAQLTATADEQGCCGKGVNASQAFGQRFALALKAITAIEELKNA